MTEKDTVLITCGNHAGEWRRISRGIRAMCRPVLSRWDADFAAEAAAVDRVREAFANVPPPGDILVWVPGHDGSGGPGYELARILSKVWSIPMWDVVQRSHLMPSAHSADIVRPTKEQQELSMYVGPSTLFMNRRFVVVDNTIASGSSMAGAVSALRRQSAAVAAAVAISIDYPTLKTVDSYDRRPFSSY
jgi:phosphoribosylpyrophosphate synthetase